MPLPEGIPTVTVTGRYLTPDGTPLTGQVVWRAPALLTFPEHDVILGGPVTVPLDAQGAFSVTLPATDAPGMNPSGWSYTVAEQFPNVAQNRVYNVLLPTEAPAVDIDDLAPTDPTTPNYVAVRGDSAYEVAVEAGFVGTVEQWLASLVGDRGPQGVQGEQGPQGAPGDSAYEVALADGFVGTEAEWLASLEGPEGPQGPQGAPGIVQSVNGQSAAEIVLDAADVNAVADTAPGAPGGVAQLDAGGKVPTAQLPDTGGAVDSVNGQTGTVVLDAGDVSAIPAADKGAPSGVAELDPSGRLPIEQAPAAAGRNMWTPQALGFQAWALDPSAVIYRDTSPPQRQIDVQRLYFSGMNITEATDVNAVVIFARGWGGSALVPDARFYAAIYDESGARVATSGEISNLDPAGQIPGTSSQASGGHVGAVPAPLTGTVNLSPGRYWAAFVMTAGASNDFYYLPVENWSPTPPANFFLGATAFQRQWYIDSQTGAPTSVDQSAGSTNHDPPIMALALL